MRLRDPLISVATILTLSAATALAAPVKPGQSTHGSPKTTTTPAPKTTTTPAPKTTTTVHGKAAASTTHDSGHGGPKKTSSTTGTGTTSNTGSTGMTASNTTATHLNPIAQKISANKGLSSKMSTLLPPHLSLNEASKGFKNQGQFIAALHVSRNLGIPFADLKEAMTGIRPMAGSTTSGGTTHSTTTAGTAAGSTTTGSTNSTTTQPLLSLGQAIHKLRPGADATSAETRATTQATADLGGK